MPHPDRPRHGLRVPLQVSAAARTRRARCEKRRGSLHLEEGLQAGYL